MPQSSRLSSVLDKQLNRPSKELQQGLQPAPGDTTTTEEHDNAAAVAVQEGAGISPRFLMQAGGCFVSILLLSILLSGSPFIIFLVIVVVTLVFALMHRDCPSDDSFDSKRQLKRVLRGHHLADDDPGKPKGFVGQNWRRLQASIATELPSVMGQHHVTIQPIGTIAKVARVRVQQKEYTWMGVMGRWLYVGVQDMAEEACELTDQTIT